MFDLMSQWWQDFVDLVDEIFIDLWEMLQDLVIWIYKSFVEMIQYVFNSITLPDFINDGLSPAVGSFNEAVQWGLVQVGFAQCLAILGIGASFYVLRKLVTLGRW